MASIRPPAREAVLAVALSLSVAAPLVAWGPPGVDLAAHAYQLHLVRDHAGIPLWDNYWYSGSYRFITYSPLWSPVAGVVGVFPLGLASIAAGAGAFALVTARLWGRDSRWSSRSFAVVWGATVTSGAYPFLMGAALGLIGLWCLHVWWSRDRCRSWRSVPAGAFAVSALLCLAASPLAFLGLGLAAAAAALALGRSGVRLARPLGILAGLSLAQVMVLRAFPGQGRYPFWAADLAEILGLCAVGVALTWRVPRARVLVAGLVVYGAASVVAFFVTSPVGANMARLGQAAVPVVALAAGLRGWRPRPACVLALVAAGAWNLIPVAGMLADGGTAAGAGAGSWRPVVAFLHARLEPSYRVEAVDTVGHWAADYLAGARIPLVRGWYRQDDFPTNALLYRSGALAPHAYLSWLRSLGVAYVVRTHARPDFSSSAENRLLAGGRSGLAVAFSDRHATVYAVPAPRPIVTGPAPAEVVVMHRTSMTIRVGAPGTYRLAVHWTPYWRASVGCVGPAPGQMTTLVVPGAAAVRVGFHVDLGRLTSTVLGRGYRACGTYSRGH